MRKALIVALALMAGVVTWVAPAGADTNVTSHYHDAVTNGGGNAFFEEVKYTAKNGGKTLAEYQRSLVAFIDTLQVGIPSPCTTPGSQGTGAETETLNPITSAYNTGDLCRMRYSETHNGYNLTDAAWQGFITAFFTSTAYWQSVVGVAGAHPPTPNAPGSPDAQYGARGAPGLQSGHTSPSTVTYPYTTTSDGQVIQDKLFTQPITIANKNVTFKNDKWDLNTAGNFNTSTGTCTTSETADRPWDVASGDNHSGLVFDHVEFADALPTIGSSDSAHPWIVTNSIFRGSKDGVGDTARGGEYLNVYDSQFLATNQVCDNTPTGGAHVDGIQSASGVDLGMTLVHNTFTETAVDRFGASHGNAAIGQNECATGPASCGSWALESNDINWPSAYPIRATPLDHAITLLGNKVHSNWINAWIIDNDDTYLACLSNVDETGAALSPSC